MSLALALCLGAARPAHAASGQESSARTSEGRAGEAAQPDVPPRRRVSARGLLQGQGVAASFGELRRALRPGDEVVVTDEAGRARRGRVASISGDQLVVASPVAAGKWEAILTLLPPFWWPVADLGVVLKRRLAPSLPQTFTEVSANRIDIVDPTRNGTAIGAAVGAGIAAGVYLAERRAPPSSLKGLGTFLALAWGVPISMRIGHVLDRAINEPVYLRQPGTRQVGLYPRIEPGVKGVVITVTFH